MNMDDGGGGGGGGGDATDAGADAHSDTAAGEVFPNGTGGKPSSAAFISPPFPT